MTRYFETTNASLPLLLSGYSFVFEPIEQFGGAWRGILKTDDESAANVLAAHKGPVSEVTAEEFESLKKKWLQVETKHQDSQSFSAAALEIHQVSQGVAAADLKPTSGQTSNASTVGKLETGNYEITDDLAPPGSQKKAPAKQAPAPEPEETTEDI